MIGISDVLDDFDSLEHLSEADYAWFEAQGVPPGALGAPDPVRVAFVVFDCPGRFSFAHPDEGFTVGAPVRAYIFLVRDEADEPIDVLAWVPETGRLGCWYGRAWALGAEVLGASNLVTDGRLHVSADLPHWLRNNRVTLFLVDALKAAGRLEGCTLFVESEATRVALRDALIRPAPEIVVWTEGVFA